MHQTNTGSAAMRCKDGVYRQTAAALAIIADNDNVPTVPQCVQTYQVMRAMEVTGRRAA